MDPIDLALTALGGIPYLTECGKPFAGGWAEAIPDDWQAALLTWAIYSDWSMHRSNASEGMLAWARENRPEYSDAHQRDLRNRLMEPTQRIVKDRIWGQLPSKIRRADTNFRFQVQSVFTYDLTGVALNCLLQQQGMPAGFYGMVCEAYKAGRFPCGYQGEYPNGQLVIY